MRRDARAVQLLDRDRTVRQRAASENIGLSARGEPWHARWARSASAERRRRRPGRGSAPASAPRRPGWTARSASTSSRAPDEVRARHQDRAGPRRPAPRGRVRGADPERRRRRERQRAVVQARPRHAVQRARPGRRPARRRGPTPSGATSSARSRAMRRSALARAASAAAAPRGLASRRSAKSSGRSSVLDVRLGAELDEPGPPRVDDDRHEPALELAELDQRAAVERRRGRGQRRGTAGRCSASTRRRPCRASPRRTRTGRPPAVAGSTRARVGPPAALRRSRARPASTHPTPGAGRAAPPPSSAPSRPAPGRASPAASTTPRPISPSSAP